MANSEGAGSSGRRELQDNVETAGTGDVESGTVPGNAETAEVVGDGSALYANMDNPYMGYDGDIHPKGSVTINFPQAEAGAEAEGSIAVSYDLHGLEPDCVDCGIHIHTGTSCDDADGVGDHYYLVDVDPWTTDVGTVYNSDSNGNARGTFTVSSGYNTFLDNLGHAVVIHSQDGTRVSCGTLGSAPNSKLTNEEERYPLLIPPDTTTTVYVVVSPPDDEDDDGVDDNIGTSFKLLSSESSSPPTGEEEGGGVWYAYDDSLRLYEGSSIVKGYLTDPDSPGGATITHPNSIEVIEPTVFNGGIYYDLFDPTMMNLDEYYDSLEYELHDNPGCDAELSTGYKDTVGSYGFMFDVISKAEPLEEGEDGGEFLDGFRNVEIHGIDLYIRNMITTSFEIYVRKGGPNKSKFVSYSDATGQTLIDQNWELVAEGSVEGKGPDAGTPTPVDAWKKTVTIEPGQTVGFYVTVTDAPDLRYRNSTKPEGMVYASDDVLGVTVGRAWGEYPLKGDGKDVYFPGREFSGALHYHAREGLCTSVAPSLALSLSPAPTMPPVPLAHSYANAEEDGMCPGEGSLETTFEDTTGSYGALFDMLAKSELTITGLDLNVSTWQLLLRYQCYGDWIFTHTTTSSFSDNLLRLTGTLARPHTS